MSLRAQVDKLLPNWEQWYPSLFDAAVDLGVLKAQVCSPSQLLLSTRHRAIHSAALHAHREQWGGELQDVASPLPSRQARGRRRTKKQKSS